ncbi:MAG: type II toxin-antitoxin system PemK/MazF family toxin [Candidatus Paceibacterota bacterium]|jgi:mRNA interferase MazF
MISKTEIKCGDLYLADFNPSIGHEYQGKRPALVIEADRQIIKSSLITVLPLTSNLENKNDEDIFIKVDKENQLKFDSIIKVYDIVSFDRIRFINRIGKIDQETHRIVKNYLLKHFNL